MKRKLIRTADGSPSLELEGTEETYHSRHGAVTESSFVFIEHGLTFFKDRTSIDIFEMGFGTGLNAMLSKEFAHENNITVHYTGIEGFPLETAEWQAITNAYDGECKYVLDDLHSLDWNVKHEISPLFHFEKIDAELETYQPGNAKFDIIFYDAFGPKVQPDLWSLAAMEFVTGLLKPGGMLVTYCAQGQFRRNLRELDLKVQSLPGPPGKREMTRAFKPLTD
jgi:tRNA U34 5-methylaminomethyl-2-thiouridine-forming methyltransferase MnmC